MVTPATPAVRDKLASIQLVRAIAAFLVVLYHAATMLGPAGAAGAAFRDRFWISRALGFAGVDLFFVVSGVVMTISCYDSLGRPGAVRSFLKRRIARIYPLYWLVLVAVISLRFAAPNLAHRDVLDADSIVRSVLLLPQDQYPIVAVAWTLTFEVYFYAVFAIMLALPGIWFLRALLVWESAVILAAVYFERSVAPSLEANLHVPLPASPLALEFMAGCAIGWVACRRKMPYPRLALMLGVVLFAVVGTNVGRLSPDAAMYGLARVAIFGGGAALAIYGLVGLELAGRMRVGTRARFWGDASYALYLTHVYVIMAGALVGRSTIDPQMDVAWDALFFVSILACGIVAAVCHVAVERPLTKAARRILCASERPASPDAKVLASHA